MEQAQQLLSDVHACTLCKDKLPLGPRPVLQFSPDARILIAGQAPGHKVHQTGIPFDDASGERLRSWLGIDKTLFYDADKIAILPMGFCYPGRGQNGDLPPRPECADAWREQLLALMPHRQLTLVIGRYAMAYHMPEQKGSLTETVRDWRDYWPSVLPLPHPSPRNNIWLSRHPWFEAEVLSALQSRVLDILSAD